MADIGSELLDVCGMLKDDFIKYDGSQTWTDLRKYLTDKQMEELKVQLDLLNYKEAHYKNLIKNNLGDSWNPMNMTKSDEVAV